MELSFSNLYANLYLPVLVFANTMDMPVIYCNVRANLLLAPSHSVDNIGRNTALGNLSDLLRFQAPEENTVFLQMVRDTGHVDNYKTEILAFDGEVLPVSISGNTISLAAPNDHFVLYLEIRRSGWENTDYNNRITAIINAAFLAEDVDASIQMTLAQAGRQSGVGRAYIFEEISPTATCNTYEWCAAGIEPEIQNLQYLSKADYNYDIIINSGMFITEDVSSLQENDRLILEQQGVKALCIIPFYDNGVPMGYIGFDDCNTCREWGHEEIQFIKSISALVASLIKRRNAEQASKRGQEILQIVSDNSEDVIYVRDLDDYTLTFVSRSLASSLGTSPEQLIGHICWQVLQEGQEGPCPFCPASHIEWMPGEERSKPYVWEPFNTRTKHTYLAKDNIVKWVDGKFVHMETALDITPRKEYEDQLQHLASTDTMTGAYKREWGLNLLTDRLTHSGPAGSLCFLDLDGLKHANDNYGHDIGDALITDTIRCVRSFLADDELICRWGGDEFLLLLKCRPEEAANRIQAIQARMDEINATIGKPYKLSFSFGIVPFEPGPGASLDALVTAADTLMYTNKMDKRGFRRRRDD